MVYSYTPTYYSSLQDTITSLCKTILPFSLKKRRLPALAAEQKLAKQQSENLKWQQESYHGIMNLIGLHKEGIVSESEVSAFRTHLLDTLITSPPSDQEQPAVLRDKLLFLQELFYAKCISVEEYHSSKRPLLQRLAVQGAEIDCRDVIVAGMTDSEEEWSVIEFKDEQCLVDKDRISASTSNKAKHRSPMKQIKGAVSKISITSPYKYSKNKCKKEPSDSDPLCPLDANRPSTVTDQFESFKENPFWEMPLKDKNSENSSILMLESSPPRAITAEKEVGTEKTQKKAHRSLFQKEGTMRGIDRGSDLDERVSKSVKKQWGFDGFKKWKRSNGEDESAKPYLAVGERSDDVASAPLVTSPIGEGPNTKLIKKKIHSNGSASDFFIDKVLGDNIKKELSRIQTELCTKNQNLNFSNDQIEAISTRLPVDKADLKKFFPKSWCDRYGDVVLDVVRKEFKDHVGEMETLRNAAKEKNHNNSARWVSFEEKDENSHPNLFYENNQSSFKQIYTSKEDHHYYSNSNCFINNPFYDDHNGGGGGRGGDKLISESAFFQNQNPFWKPRG